MVWWRLVAPLLLLFLAHLLFMRNLDLVQFGDLVRGRVLIQTECPLSLPLQFQSVWTRLPTNFVQGLRVICLQFLDFFLLRIFFTISFFGG